MTKAFCFVILCKLAYGKLRKSEPANLENDTEKKRAIRRKHSEDSESETSEKKMLKD